MNWITQTEKQLLKLLRFTHCQQWEWETLWHRQKLLFPPLTEAGDHPGHFSARSNVLEDLSKSCELVQWVTNGRVSTPRRRPIPPLTSATEVRNNKGHFGWSVRQAAVWTSKYKPHCTRNTWKFHDSSENFSGLDRWGKGVDLEIEAVAAVAGLTGGGEETDDRSGCNWSFWRLSVRQQIWSQEDAIYLSWRSTMSLISWRRIANCSSWWWIRLPWASRAARTWSESAESMMVASSYCNDKQCTNCGLKGRTTQYQMVAQTVFNTDAVRYTGGQSDKAEVSKLQRQRQSQ